MLEDTAILNGTFVFHEADCRGDMTPVSAHMRGRDPFQVLHGMKGCSLYCMWSLSSLSQAGCKKDTGSKTLVSGHIISWETSAAFPLAQLCASLGQAGELATEMQVRVCVMLQCR